jgi:hypothetical protein
MLNWKSPRFETFRVLDGETYDETFALFVSRGPTPINQTLMENLVFGGPCSGGGIRYDRPTASFPET